jgi:hypothetical protein
LLVAACLLGGWGGALVYEQAPEPITRPLSVPLRVTVLIAAGGTLKGFDGTSFTMVPYESIKGGRFGDCGGVAYFGRALEHLPREAHFHLACDRGEVFYSNTVLPGFDRHAFRAKPTAYADGQVTFVPVRDVALIFPVFLAALIAGIVGALMWRFEDY